MHTLVSRSLGREDRTDTSQCLYIRAKLGVENVVLGSSGEKRHLHRPKIPWSVGGRPELERLLILQAGPATESFNGVEYSIMSKKHERS